MAGDHMYGMDAERLLSWILKDLENGSALGLAKDLFFVPRKDDPFRMRRYGVTLETPLGVAAGPHTQMAQNLVAAWLAGARYMELKTVQVLDQITVTKPCIDMADEGYNCEWSQELTLDGSYQEYLKAWVILHILHDLLGGPEKADGPGMIFNMSAGYSMEGILSPTMRRFLDRMMNAETDVEALKKRLARVYPRAAELKIPGRISDNLTISCMHGCPPREVEKIALYFIEGLGLNTTLKMNPTLLGAGRVREILNKNLGFSTEVPDLAFEHDIPYSEAQRIIKSCLAAAAKKGVAFGVKLTNTLETVNKLQNLPDNEKMVYMSGRALHPISIALAARLQKDFGGELDMSFCAGVDALNVADTLACGLVPVTICSDLLKPGGYGRMARYFKNLRAAMAECGAANLEAFACARAGIKNYKAAVQKNLEACDALASAPGSRYAKAAGKAPAKKDWELRALDCKRYCGICVSVCPNRAYVALESAERSFPVQEVTLENGQARIVTKGRGGISQPCQVLNIGDFCNECGNCAAFCPSAGAPYRAKRRLHLSETSFKADSNGFFRYAQGLLKGKRQGEEWTLRLTDQGYVYEDSGLRARLDKENLAALEVELLGGRAVASLSGAVEAAVFAELLENVFFRRSFVE